MISLTHSRNSRNGFTYSRLPIEKLRERPSRLTFATLHQNSWTVHQHSTKNGWIARPATSEEEEAYEAYFGQRIFETVPLTVGGVVIGIETREVNYYEI